MASQHERQHPPRLTARLAALLSMSHVFRIHHLLVTIALLALLFTGWGAHASARAEGSLTAGLYPAWMPTARIQMYHLIAAVLFLPPWIVSIFTFVRRGRLKDLRPIRRIVNLVMLLGGGIAVFTGLLLLFGVGGHAVWRVLHGIAAVLILAGLLVHLVLALLLGWKAILASMHLWRQPTWGAALFSLVLFIPSCFLVFNGLPFVPPGRVLEAPRIASPGEDLKALPWDRAVPLEVPLYNGAGLFSGETVLILRALHDGRELFMLAEWKDEKEDKVYMPWERTEEGWKWWVSNPKDETVYYEDKFSLLFPTTPSLAFRTIGCTVYCHLGGGNPYGIKGSEEIVDVWHWKRSRTGPAGYMDDKYWWHIDMESEDKGRYGDPKEGKGYVKNVNPEKTGPLYLPVRPDVEVGGAIPWEHALPCTPEHLSKVAVGQLVPGIVMGPVSGDRGNVRCTFEHRDGTWRLYMRRLMDTGSKYDVRFEPGGSHPFGCAVFDHNAKRHAYNHLVYYLEPE